MQPWRDHNKNTIRKNFKNCTSAYRILALNARRFSLTISIAAPPTHTQHVSIAPGRFIASCGKVLEYHYFDMFF